MKTKQNITYKTYPGLVMAESNERNLFVAQKNNDCFFLRKSLIAVNIAVVSILDSIDKFGFSRSKQNSSISSNNIIHFRKDINRLKTYRIRAETLDNPSAKNAAVSITTKSYPIRFANDSQIVVLAVPAFIPRRMIGEVGLAAVMAEEPGMCHNNDIQQVIDLRGPNKTAE